MHDRISRYRVARLSLYPPSRDGGNWRYAIVASTIKRGIPDARIIADGIMSGGKASPTAEEVIEAMDAALRQWMLTG